MNDNELKAIVRAQLDNSLTISSELEVDQGDALDYYYGRVFGNEVKGRSQVVTRDVLETIEWIMPSLLRVFASGKKTVNFDATSEQDEEAAEQETDIVNHVFNKDNKGFIILHNWFKDALLQKVGYTKTYWETEKEVLTEQYTGLSDAGLSELLQDKEVEPVEHTAYSDFIQSEPVNYHDITIKRTTSMGKLRVDNIPQEEIRVHKDTNSINLDKAIFVAHVTNKTQSDLLEMGYDKKVIDQLGEDEDSSYGSLETSRAEYDEQDQNENDQSMRPITVNECYIRTDYNDDGIAELRRVVYSGNTILENDEWDHIPFAALTPIIMPHKHIGMSEADLVMDLQLIKSTLTRQMLDNLYFTNNPEKEVLQGKVNMNDLMTSLPGGIKRVKQMGSIREITVPFTAGASMPMLELLDGMKETRTGVSKHTMGIDADTLAQSTKGAFLGGLKQANQRIEMLARVFAETGVKDLFLKIHSLLIKNQDKARELKINGEWQEINPSEWRERKDMTVAVGLGTGDTSEIMQRLFKIAEKQEQHLLKGSPLVSPKNLYNTYDKLIELADLKDVDLYFQNPENLPKPQPKDPSPEQLIAQAQVQMARDQIEIARRKGDLEIQKLQLDIEKAKDARVAKERDFVKDQQEIAIKLNDSQTKTADVELTHGFDIPNQGVIL